MLIATQDDNLRLALTFLFMQEPGARIIGSTDSTVGLLALAQNTPIELVVLDQKLSGVSTVETIRRLREVRPQLKILLIHSTSDPIPGEPASCLTAVVNHHNPPDALLTAFRALYKPLIMPTPPLANTPPQE